jgi:ubiquinone/menaquinone biosynthesis C-methylase UbiE
MWIRSFPLLSRFGERKGPVGAQRRWEGEGIQFIREGAEGPHPPTALRAAGPSLSPGGRGAGKGTLAALLLLAACNRTPQPPASPFPEPHRPVSPISSRYLNEDTRESQGEFATVSRLADVRPRMSVADIGAGGGYYTVRLSPLVGPKGRVLAEDIVPETIRTLGQRIQRERLDNVAIRLGQPNNPQLPPGSFDRVFMIHMYHEIARPSEFLWNLRAALKPDGRVIVVDADRPTDRHGTPQRLLVCEFNALGYGLTRFERLPDSEAYFAQFEARAPRPEPQDIPACIP